MSKERIETLLYNAIVLMENDGWDFDEMCYELGMTEEEYVKLMETE